ncbi:ABC transporter ATP-binding protein [Brucellaceae bacterium D45D]
MSSIAISQLDKAFGSNHVLSNVNLDIEQGEFVAVLGPSGCGKTTLLRMIAGFEQLDQGTIAIGGKTVSSPAVHIAPEQRNLGIVFQNYALWPHMNVADNVGYSLKVRKVPVQDRNRRVTEALKTVEMLHLSHRRPADLSGGQRQRVALARCLAQDSKIVLLDEPLANLDVNLRSAMEEEFSKFHRSTGASLFYITHDQAEAMALADRIAVMDKGVIQQFSTPDMLYREPLNEMVANFIGEGFTLLVGHVSRQDEQHAIVKFEGHEVRVRCAATESQRSSGMIALHPENLVLAPENEGCLRVRITRTVFRGSHVRIEAEPVRFPDQKITFHAVPRDNLQTGQTVSLRIADAWLLPAHASDKASSSSIA